MRGEISKYLYIDSSCDNGRVSLPPQPFSCADHESMSFTLLSFSMRRNFPQISAINNRFYIYVRLDQSFYEVIIPPGDYGTYEAIKDAINIAIAATILANATETLGDEVTSIVCAPPTDTCAAPVQTQMLFGLSGAGPT